MEPDSVLELVRYRDGSWTSRSAISIPVPPTSLDAGRPWRVGTKDVVWYGRGRGPGTPPFVVRYRVDGGVDTVFMRGSDDDLGSVSPLTGELLILSDNAGTPGVYDRDVLLARPDGSGARVLVANGKKNGPPRWSPDGRMIIFREAEALTVLDSVGQRIGSLADVPQLQYDWCGPDAVMSAIQDEYGGRVRVLDVRTGQELFMFGNDVLPSLPTCSPDGSAVVYHRPIDRRPAVMLRDLASGRETLLMREPPNGHVVWLQDTPLPSPVALRIHPNRIAVQLGARTRARASLELEDGTTREPFVTWESSQPSSVFVSGDGRISGIRPGQAHVIARHGSGLADSTRVTVLDDPVAELELLEQFEEIDARAWTLVGDPPPTSHNGRWEPALELRGDGSFADGLLSKRFWDAQKGLTVELQFWMKLSRTDHQWIGLCLVEGPHPSPGESTLEFPPRFRQSQCFHYPGGELDRFDSRAVTLGDYLRRFPDVLPTDDWVHVGIQLDSDGETAFLLDRRIAFTLPTLVDVGPGTRWRVMILGASEDTELLVRDLRVWEGARYLPEGEGGSD